MKIAKAIIIIKENEPGLCLDEEVDIDFDFLRDETLSALMAFADGVSVDPNGSLCELFKAMTITTPVAAADNIVSNATFDSDGAVGGIITLDDSIDWLKEYELLFGTQHPDFNGIDWNLIRTLVWRIGR